VKKWLKNKLPHPQQLKENRHLSVFGKLLHEPNIWHINRRSAAGAFAVGLFMMYMPPVGQMLMAAAAAIALRVNLPISVALVWISNPVTIPPMFYFAYLVGAWMIGSPPLEFRLDFWMDLHNWLAVLRPLALGMLVCAIACSATGYFSVQALWRWNLRREIRRRKERYRSMAAATSSSVSETELNRPSARRQV